MNPWIHAARPKTLGISVCPVLMGTALAYIDGQFHPLAFAAALLGAVMIQVGTNFANDYFDYFKGADTAQRIGPMKVLQKALIKPHEMRTAIVFAFGFAALCGLYLVYRAGFSIAVLGMLSIACGLLYTAGPFSLAYLGISELFVIAFFGIAAVGGTYFVQALEIDSRSVMLGFVPGLLGCAPLVLNNLRDCEEDARAHKKTLVVRFGKNFAKAEFALAMLLPFILLLYAAWDEYNLGLLAVCTIMLVASFIQVYRVWKMKQLVKLNQVFASVGKIIWMFGPLFFLAVVLN